MQMLKSKGLKIDHWGTPDKKVNSLIEAKLDQCSTKKPLKNWYRFCECLSKADEIYFVMQKSKEDWLLIRKFF